MFDKLLIANRGEIACRIIRTARRMGLATVAVYSEADRGALHTRLADETVAIGPAPASESYLRADGILEAARATGAQAIHPGYGFLSENAGFARAVQEAGLIFVGPPAAAIEAMGLKDGAKRLMDAAGVPVVPGYHGAEQDPEHLASEAARIGYPVLIKAVAGGGGKGMRRVDEPGEFVAALASARREAAKAFGEDRVLVEKFIARPRHVEIQVFADAHGEAVHLFERDCSLQRRHQKVIEEAPAPGMPEDMRAAMGRAAVDAARAVGYQGAGTVEFIADGSAGLRADRFFFMEMNTRLQVEHPVTELVTGVDLVEWQLRVAAGEPLPMTQEEIGIRGHAVEARLYAENPVRGFLPSTGRLDVLDLPEGEGLRIDTGVRQGDRITPYYDPMIAKIIAWGPDRTIAIDRLVEGLRGSRLAGLQGNTAFLARLADHPAFRRGDFDTGFIDAHGADLVPASEDAPLWSVAIGLFALRGPSIDPSSSRDPWDRRDGWRLSGRGVETLTLAAPEGVSVRLCHEPSADEATLRMEIGEAEVTVSGAWSAHRPQTSLLDVVVNGQRIEAAVAFTGDGVIVFRHAEAHGIRVLDPLTRRSGPGEATGGITAPMPGKIISVAVTVGDEVQRGQPLVVLEAMKMEHTLRAGADGVITQLTGAPGDQVEEGALLVTVGAAEA